ncbi:MAG TPA: AMP-binding protein [Actinomycetes bacterium]|nr:AMP-binding protein [Actinomycetes bacterium]
MPQSGYEQRPWHRQYGPRVPVAVQVPPVPVTALLDEAANDFPRSPALGYFGRSINYRRLRQQVDLLAGSLRELGVARGDRVAMVLPNCPEFVLTFYAALRLGAIAVPLNPAFNPSELRYRLADCEAELIVVAESSYEQVADARAGTPLRDVVVAELAEFLPRRVRTRMAVPSSRGRALRRELSGQLPAEAQVLYFDELLNGSPGPAKQQPIRPDHDIAALFYTAGATARPRGAMLTHSNLVAAAYQSAVWDPQLERGEEATLAVLPLHHPHALVLGIVGTVLAASTVVLVPTGDLDDALAAAKEWGPATLAGSPELFGELAAWPHLHKRTLRSLRCCVSGLVDLPAELAERFEARTGTPVVNSYGLAESAGLALVNPLGGYARPATAGLPLPSTDVVVVDEQEPTRILPMGSAGELLIRGPQVFAGYWNNEQDTATTLRNGWLRTGDIAVMNLDGFVTIVDRKDDLVITDGLGVFPSEIEHVLLEHPAIADCAVVGLPDPRHGQRIAAAVVGRPGAAVLHDQLREFCGGRLPPQLVPQVIAVRGDIPRNHNGAILRRAVREQMSESIRPGYPDATSAPTVPAESGEQRPGSTIGGRTR